MKLRAFYRIFPPPKFLQMPAVGLDISDHAIRFVELIPKKKSLALGRVGEYKLPSGLVSYGDIEDINGVRAVLKQIGREFDISNVRISVPEKKAFLVQMELPRMDKSEIRGAVELHLEEHIPMKPEEVLFDYTVLGYTNENCSTYVVGVSVLARETAEKYSELFSDTGITALSLEIEAQAVARSVVPHGDNDTYMIVDLGRLRTGVYVVKDGLVRFTSNVDLGGEALTLLIQERLSVTQDEAQKIKREFNFATGFHKERKDLAEPLMAHIATIRDEINKRYIYWNGRRVVEGDKKKDPIRKIMIAGSEAGLLGIQEYLAATLNTDVEMANVWVNAFSLDDEIPDIRREDSFKYATAIGLALHENQHND